jgi:hypothetical protein
MDMDAIQLGLRAGLGALLITVLSSGGCTKQEPVTQQHVDLKSNSAATQTASISALRQRADQLWKARQDEDWTTAFTFEDPEERKQATAEEFATWSRESDPFKVLSYKLGKIEIEGSMGWVEVEHTSKMRRFATMPERTDRIWEKWRRLDNTWYPVPQEVRDAYPASPALRNADEEKLVRDRFELSWKARNAQDWNAMYELTDPADHEKISVSTLANAYSRFKYQSRNVLWVEAIGTRAQVRVTIACVINDPSLNKMEPQDITLSEPWVKRDGTWYLDLFVNPE